MAIGKVPMICFVLGLITLGIVAGGEYRVPGTTTSTTIIMTSSNYESATGLSIPNSINPVNPATIPLGDGSVSSTPEMGHVDSCQSSFNGKGAEVNGPWINTAAKTWDSETKVAVQGSVSWPGAYYSVTVMGESRMITGNDEPVGHTTGTFPILRTDPAYQYDTNPNHIAPQNVNIMLPLNPTIAASPTCVGLGPVGILNDGVYLYNALDAEGRDAGAHETLDSSQGHPDSSDTYHHHEVPTYMLENATALDSATLVGYASDGFGIYIERDANGNLLTNANLDACHGTTSIVPWNGALVDIYHYVATIEYPYTVGCYMGNLENAGPTMSMSSTITPPSTSSSTVSSTSVSSVGSTSSATIFTTSATGTSSSAATSTM